MVAFDATDSELLREQDQSVVTYFDLHAAAVHKQMTRSSPSDNLKFTTCVVGIDHIDHDT